MPHPGRSDSKGKKRARVIEDSSEDELDEDIDATLKSSREARKHKKPRPKRRRKAADTSSSEEDDVEARLQASNDSLVAVTRQMQAQIEQLQRDLKNSTTTAEAAPQATGDEPADGVLGLHLKKKKIIAAEWRRMLGWSKKQWTRSRSHAREAVIKAPLNMRLSWKQQDAKKLGIALDKLETDVPDFRRFESGWGGMQMLQECFNHMRANRMVHDDPNDEAGEEVEIDEAGAAGEGDDAGEAEQADKGSRNKAVKTIQGKQPRNPKEPVNNSIATGSVSKSCPKPRQSDPGPSSHKPSDVNGQAQVEPKGGVQNGRNGKKPAYLLAAEISAAKRKAQAERKALAQWTAGDNAHSANDESSADNARADDRAAGADETDEEDKTDEAANAALAQAMIAKEAAAKKAVAAERAAAAAAAAEEAAEEAAAAAAAEEAAIASAHTKVTASKPGKPAPTNKQAGVTSPRKPRSANGLKVNYFGNSASHPSNIVFRDFLKSPPPLPATETAGTSSELASRATDLSPPRASNVLAPSTRAPRSQVSVVLPARRSSTSPSRPPTRSPTLVATSSPGAPSPAKSGPSQVAETIGKSDSLTSTLRTGSSPAPRPNNSTSYERHVTPGTTNIPLPADTADTRSTIAAAALAAISGGVHPDDKPKKPAGRKSTHARKDATNEGSPIVEARGLGSEPKKPARKKKQDETEQGPTEGPQLPHRERLPRKSQAPPGAYVSQSRSKKPKD